MDFEKYKHKLPYATRKKNPEANAAYNAEQAEILDRFKKDLFDDLGITNNPKREKLYAKAWEFGHSSGYSEVYSYAQDLIDLID